jgi:Phosphotransferase enzyme family
MSRPPIAVLREDLETHPALQAWRDFGSLEDVPERIEVLRQHGVVGVYRLVGAGMGGESIIAKRTPAAKASVERTVYEALLPQMPVTTPRFYGALSPAESETHAWFFLEDVGAERYSDANPEHLALTARWVARVHGAAADLPAARTLPDGGPGRYHEHLMSARDKIGKRLSGPDLTPNDVTLLQAVLDRLQRLASDWSLIESLCVGLPATLVHGDFRPKNVYLRRNGAGLACYPIDWETAGWGVPAADLTRIDVAAYWSAARESRADLSLDTVQRLATLGQVFRTIAAIDWESASLRFETRRMISQPLASLAVLLARLTDAVRMTGVPA